jgi:hypothetical protein
VVRAGEWVIRAAIVALGIFASIVGIWGPPWPTSPVFSPGLPSYGAAVDVPFEVGNKSLLFGFSNLKISCKVRGRIVSEIAPNGIVLGADVAFAARGTNSLSPSSSGTFVCPIRKRIGVGGKDAADLFQSAQITFLSEYDSRLLWGRSHAEDGPFTWITTTAPPHWARGVPLK